MPNRIVKGRVVLPDRVVDRGIVVTQGKTIRFVGEERDYRATGTEVLHDYSGHWVIPGMIDLHVHGGAGFDVMDGTPEALREIGKHLCRYGVTGYLPTTMTAPYDMIERAIQAIAEVAAEPDGYAQILGVHLEGPWINPRHKGAQRESDIQPPALQQAEEMLARSGGLLRMVTIAPELPGALDVIATLSKHNVICSIGHSDATWEEVQRAVNAGASHFTHLYNAMRGLHHREPGVVGAALQLRQCSCDIIADLVHVHPAAIELVYRSKRREKLMLISDGIRAVGMGDGTFELGGQTVHVRHCIARLADGTLAGSTLTLDRAVKHMVEEVGVPVTDAVYMAATAPAEKLGIAERKGSLAAGKDADIAVLSDQFQPLLTMVNGSVAFQQGEQLRS